MIEMESSKKLLNIAENTYNELLANISKFNSMEDFLEDLAYGYDAYLTRIMYCLRLDYKDELYCYLDSCISKEMNWNDTYEGL